MIIPNPNILCNFAIPKGLREQRAFYIVVTFRLET